MLIWLLLYSFSMRWRIWGLVLSNENRLSIGFCQESHDNDADRRWTLADRRCFADRLAPHPRSINLKIAVALEMDI